MKKLALLTLLACGVGAHASFELMLVANGANGAIQRYDGETGTYFGSIGYGNGLKSISLNRSKNQRNYHTFDEHKVLMTRRKKRDAAPEPES